MNAADLLQIRPLARTLADAFQVKVRPSSGQEFLTLRDGSPGWCATVVQLAHGLDLLPEDWRHQFIYRLADGLANARSVDDVADLPQQLVDGDGTNLTGWLASHGSRPDYVSQALADAAKARRPFVDVWALLSRSQLLEVRDVLDLLIKALLVLAPKVLA